MSAGEEALGADARRLVAEARALLGDASSIDDRRAWFRSPETRRIGFELCRIGKSAVDEIVRLLDEEIEELRHWALHELFMIGLMHGIASVARAAPRVIALIHDGDADDQIQVAEALVRIAPTAPEVMQSATHLLGTAHAKCRFRAGFVIHDLAEQGAAVPAESFGVAIDCLSSPKWYTRLGGCMALQVARDRPDAIGPLAQCLEDEEQRVWLPAALAYFACGGRNDKAASILLSVLNASSDPLDLTSCVKVLGAIGSDADRFRSAMVAMRDRVVGDKGLSEGQRRTVALQVETALSSGGKG